MHWLPIAGRATPSDHDPRVPSPAGAAWSQADDGDLGELTWDLSLEAGQAATIRHRFTVEHPAQVTITGL